MECPILFSAPSLFISLRRRSLKLTKLSGECMTGTLPSWNRSFSIEIIYAFVKNYSRTEKICNIHYLFSRQVLITNSYEKLLIYLTFTAYSASSY